MYLIERKSCVMCGGSLEDVCQFDNFPIYMGVTDLPIQSDLYGDMVFSKCQECNAVQLKKLVPLDILYAKGHAAVIGDTWNRHHEEFYEFIKDYVSGNVVEIGGANLILARKLIQIQDANTITVFDKNILQYQNGKEVPDKIVLREEFFDPSLVEGNVDVVIHTHLIEHLYDPIREIREMSRLLEDGSYMMFAFPLADEMFKANFTNAMNFEHTYFIDMAIVENILNFSSFEIVETKNFSPYTAFIIARKNMSMKQNIINSYPNHPWIFEDFRKHHIGEVERIKNRIDTDKENTFIFGAHIFTQFLFGFGLSSDLFSNVLDNDPAKQNNRLYGAHLEVKTPKILRDIENPLVVLKAAMYTEEIKKDILENINPNTRFIL